VLSFSLPGVFFKCSSLDFIETSLVSSYNMGQQMQAQGKHTLYLVEFGLSYQEMQHPSLARLRMERTWDWVSEPAQGHLQTVNTGHRPKYIGRLIFSRERSWLCLFNSFEYIARLFFSERKSVRLFVELFCLLRAPCAPQGQLVTFQRHKSAVELYKSHFIASKIFVEDFHVTRILCWCGIVLEKMSKALIRTSFGSS
jgi:hypothetical protein